MRVVREGKEGKVSWKLYCLNVEKVSENIVDGMIDTILLLKKLTVLFNHLQKYIYLEIVKEFN